MDKRQAEEILYLIDQFSEPINRLHDALERVAEEDERKRYRRALGEVMGLLDGQIAYPLRQRFPKRDAD